MRGAWTGKARYIRRRKAQNDSVHGATITSVTGIEQRAVGLSTETLPPVQVHPCVLMLDRSGATGWEKLPGLEASNTSRGHMDISLTVTMRTWSKAMNNGLLAQAEAWIAGEFGTQGVGSYGAALKHPERLEQLRRAASAAAFWVSVNTGRDRAFNTSYLWPEAEADLIHLKLSEPRLRPTLEVGRLSTVAAEILRQEQQTPGAAMAYEPWGHALMLGPIGTHPGELHRVAAARSWDRWTQAEVDTLLSVEWSTQIEACQTLREHFERTMRGGAASSAAFRLSRRGRQATRAAGAPDTGLRERLSKDTQGRSAPGRKAGGLLSEIDRAAEALARLLAGGNAEEDRRLAGNSTESARSAIGAWYGLQESATELRPTLKALELEIDQGVATRLGIRVAALRLEAGGSGPQDSGCGGQVIINLGAGLSKEQWARQMLLLALKVALGHPWRGQERVPDLWSLAGDLALAPTLDALNIGEAHPGEPRDDALEALGSAEAIYARLLHQPRGRLESLGTDQGNLLRAGEGDQASAMNPEEEQRWITRLALGLEERRALGQGLLSGNVLRELRDRAAEAPPWRPALTEAAQGWFPQTTRKRTYARPSRRTRSAMEPKPRSVHPPGQGHSLLVLIDTSGSVEDAVIEEALGGVRTLCGNLDVTRVRVISCDAGAHDHGWQRPWNAGENLQLMGTGGTSLQAGLDLIARAKDIDPATPLLIVTDGLFWERLEPGGREHAYLLPPRTRLPFSTSAPVFTLRGKGGRKAD